VQSQLSHLCLCFDSLVAGLFDAQIKMDRFGEMCLPISLLLGLFLEGWGGVSAWVGEV
jgi:hypothetical protein